MRTPTCQSTWPPSLCEILARHNYPRCFHVMLRQSSSPAQNVGYLGPSQTEEKMWENLRCFFSRQKIVDRMAESMDTSEIVADEDDRKLFVGGLPQVHTCWLQHCNFNFFLPTSKPPGTPWGQNTDLNWIFRTPNRRTFRYIFRLLERLITLTSKLTLQLEDLGSSVVSNT